MKIHNIRLDHACNSSSLHSIIFLDSRLKSVVESTEDSDVGDFGWQLFTAASKEVKAQYALEQIKHNLTRWGISSENAMAVARAFAGYFGPIGEDKTLIGEDKVVGIDHQSNYQMPTNFDRDFLSEPFMKDFFDTLIKDTTLILGGNDNDGETHHLATMGRRISFPLDQDIYERSDVVARKDLKGNYYSLYNTKTGSKVRMSFDDLQEAPSKASAPELVDMKITDYCPFGCAFCYQDSTLEGKHADISKIVSLIHELSSLQVFEIAIGGGEPTMHPNFYEILEACVTHHITPNFTTKSLKWLSDKKLVALVNKSVGKIAFSVDSPEDVYEVGKAVRSARLDETKIRFQHVIGTSDVDTFQRLLLAVKDKYQSDWNKKNGEPFVAANITLLGYKVVGRGGAFQQAAPFDWISEVKKAGICSIGIDTELVRVSESRMKEEKINPILYTKEEGKFSCYIDAVSNKIAPSSYCKPEEYKSLVGQSHYDERILKPFATF